MISGRTQANALRALGFVRSGRKKQQSEVFQTHPANCKIFICIPISEIYLEILVMRESASFTPTCTPWVWVVLATLDKAPQTIWVDAVNVWERPQDVGGRSSCNHELRRAGGLRKEHKGVIASLSCRCIILPWPELDLTPISVPPHPRASPKAKHRANPSHLALPNPPLPHPQPPKNH